MITALFDKNRETLLFYPSGKQEKSYIVPNGVTTIKEYAFQNKKFGRSDIASFFKKH